MQMSSYHLQEDREQTAEELADKRDAEIQGWDFEFTKVDQGTLFEMILVWLAVARYAANLPTPTQAANFLDIKPMLDLTCKTVANMIRGKKVEEIRRTFNIKNDFTPEEEEQVKKENDWCENNA